MSLGARTVRIDPGQMVTEDGVFRFATEDGVTPRVKISIDPRKQRIKQTS